ncbi:hypothetical protein [Nodularia spumigena]|uniref:Uncharacterized protein n=1 Tax=Nodularia spumigena CENA596 TaxID=1819295 RepID=A0A166KMU0_NODSP|nr:hypothetical protein [Nodularia spumigena]MDB9355443.1 hypothetical protein [Nodularia spumigena CS-587/03]KZL51320.1 hypothetical protein A2T98_02915 [Nodularia spumigena CENA596]MDB9302919.1 hypothetical protein [Nodularia spumigena CS-591/12]MDB9318462.1 hypothetical protein [Nodularia spumigena CS-590/01A]MDB9320711.1 hypothetical protein [Nodularia spumigena CS-591/07A]
MIQCRRQIPKTTQSLDDKAGSNCVETLGLAKIQRHILIFTDQTVANFCAKQVSLGSWEYLKTRRIQELKLDQPQDSLPFALLGLKPIACELVVLDR